MVLQQRHASRNVCLCGGSEHLTRLTKLACLNGREVDYTYSGDATSDALSRVSAIEDGATTLASYSYLGAGAVMRVDYEEPDVRLDLWGGTVGSYDGIDRFGRIVDHRWHNYGSSIASDISLDRDEVPALPCPEGYVGQVEKHELILLEDIDLWKGRHIWAGSDALNL